MNKIQSPDEDAAEDDKDEPLPEGFHLLEESMHCISIHKAEKFRVYCNQICTDLVQMVRQGRGGRIQEGSVQYLLGM